MPIRTITTLSDLREVIRNDEATRSPLARRFPARLLFLPSVGSLKDVVSLFDDLGLDRIELSDYLHHDDAWFTVDHLREILRSLLDRPRNVLLVPLSEVVRFLDNETFRDVFATIAEIENPTTVTRRIYIPLLGLFERFCTDFLDSFSRRDEWAPIWSLSAPTSVKTKIYITELPLREAPHLAIIRNTKEWLNLWKVENSDEVLCVSETLSRLYHHWLPDQAYDIDQIADANQAITKLCKISVPFAYEEKDQQHWGTLLASFLESNIKSSAFLVKHTFNVADVKKDDVIRLWFSSTDNFSRWLLKMYILSTESFKNTYIYHVMRSLIHLDSDELTETVLFTIFDLPKKQHFCEDRNKLIGALHVPDVLEPKLVERLEQLNDSSQQLALLTTSTMSEKKIILRLFLSEKITFSALREKYRFLYDYLSSMVIDNLTEDSAWILTYFDAYRRAKVEDALSDKVLEYLYEKNRNAESFYRWYYCFDDSLTLLARHKVNRIIWLDSLGLEWLPLIQKIITDMLKLNVTYRYAARANLPTVTECNRFENVLRIADFDTFLHSRTPYKHPDDLILEIDKVAEILRSNLQLSYNETAAIVSDHGSTALARLQDNVKTYEFLESNHEGRCMWVDADVPEDADYLIHKISASSSCTQRVKSLIALTYTSLYRRPVREVHGGATPEEVLVPLLIISKAPSPEEVSYSLSPTQLSLSRRRPILEIAIHPNPSQPVYLVVATDRILELTYDQSKGKWTAILTGLAPGNYDMRIRIQHLHYPIKVSIRGGMQEKDLI